MNLFGKKGRFEIDKCTNCGLGSTKNLKPQTGEYHRDEVYIHEQDLFENIFKRRIRAIEKYRSSPGKVLEIGSSTGLMLSVFKDRGWEVLGIEMSKLSAKFAQDKGIDTIVGTFEKSRIESGSIDVAILNHTMEHLEDPVQVISKIYRILKPGGLLLIDVPNFGSLSARYQQMNWSLLLPNEHLWHFTKESFENIFKQTGFDLIFCARPSGLWDFDDVFKELIRSFKSFEKRFFIELTTLIPSLIITKLGLGTDLTVIGRKND